MSDTDMDGAYGMLLIAAERYRSQGDEGMAGSIDQVMNKLGPLILVERRRAEVLATNLTINSD